MPEDPKSEKSSGASAGSTRRTPGKGAGGRAATPAGTGLGGSGAKGKGGANRPGGKGGRTRPQQAVVAKPKPWGLIAAAVAVVVFAAAVIGYAVYAVDKSHEDDVTAADQIEGVETFDYAAGQQHVSTPVDYTENPPVGGPHDGEWADCTGTVYSVDIRHENAVHALEHGGVWISYDPDVLSADDIQTLADVVDGNNGLLMAPYAGLSTDTDLDTPISLQSWNHRLGVTSVDDPRIQQYVDFFTFGTDDDGTSLYPEVGASCEQPAFVSDPLVVGDASRSASADTNTDAETTPTAGSTDTSGAGATTTEPSATTAP